jgi:hypothetical protein
VIGLAVVGYSGMVVQHCTAGFSGWFRLDQKRDKTVSSSFWESSKGR